MTRKTLFIIIIDIFAVLTRHSKIEAGADIVHKNIELIKSSDLFGVDEVLCHLILASGKLDIRGGFCGNRRDYGRLGCWLNGRGFLLLEGLE